ncbi:MAG: short-chain-enoyl-CoA hydratase [Bdellovibrio sp.]
MFITNKYQSILFDVQDQIGIITINRESKLNALNSEVINELKDLLTHIKNEDKNFSIKGLILTGAGEKAFIAGADIAEMANMTVDQARAFGAKGQEVTTLFEALQIPVVACVNGFALGGGCEMAMSCDFIYATKTAVFGQPEVKLGLIPGFGGTQRLSRIVGRNMARELIYSARNVNIDEAVSLGLVNKVFEDKKAMLEGAKEVLKATMKNSPLAVALAKKVINDGVDLTVAQGLSCELDQFAAVFGSEDMKEGTLAFMEKRAPKFSGK